MRVAILSLLAFTVGTGARAADPRIPFEKYRLDNGLTVILSEDHRLPQVAVDIWYHVGAANQEPGRSGFAHLFEHMGFSGSRHVQPSSWKVFEDIGSRAGALVNGTTTFDRTNFFEVIPSSELPTALWVEADRMGYLLDTLDEEKLRIQRDVVSNEKRQAVDNVPYGLAFQRMCDLLFPKPHPYYDGVIGDIADIQAASADDVRAFFRRYYGPNNATLAIVGDFETAQAKELVRRYFADIPRGPEVKVPDVPMPRLASVVSERVLDKLAELPRFTLAWNGLRQYTPEEPAGDVLAYVLGSGKTARLYRSLVVDQKIASDVAVADSTAALGGWFQIDVTAASGHGTAELRPAVQAVLDDVRKSGVTEAEVERAKRNLISTFVRGAERIGGFGGRADLLANYQTYLDDPGWFDKDIARYRAVTVEQVKAFANKYLVDDRRIELEVVPAPKAAEAPPAIAPAGPAHPRPSSPSPGAPETPLTPDQEFRHTRPAPLRREMKFDAPIPVDRRLGNGARVLVVPNHSVPLVAVELRLQHGADVVPNDKVGLADLVADAVLEGTGSRTAEQLARDIEDIAARLTSTAGRETVTVHLNVLRETLDRGLDILADVVAQPAFRPADVERAKSLRSAELEQKAGDIARLARDEASRLVYGPDHPWGQPMGGTVASVRALKREDLVAHHQAWWVPGDAVIAVSGDVEPEEAVGLLERAFARWQPRPVPRTELPPLRPAGRRFLSIIDKPGATQSQVWVAGPAPKASDPDAVALEVANNVLGGVFTSRLNLNLREKHGYSYGVFSSVELGRATGAFFARGGVVSKSTVPAVAEYEKEITAFAGGDLTEDELSRARDSYIRVLPGQLETNDAVATAMATLVVVGRPLDHYRTLAGRARKLTREEVVHVVKQWIRPEGWPIVVVGPVASMREDLAKLGLGPLETTAPR